MAHVAVNKIMQSIKSFFIVVCFTVLVGCICLLMPIFEMMYLLDYLQIDFNDENAVMIGIAVIFLVLFHLLILYLITVLTGRSKRRNQSK